MSVPEGLHYTKEHEWVLFEDNIATVGITDFAQSALGDITFVQLPKEGDSVKKDDPFGVVESVKAVSDLYSPVTGRVMEVNEPVLKAPELLNEDPYNDGWMIKVETKEIQMEGLMSQSEYADYIEEQS